MAQVRLQLTGRVKDYDAAVSAFERASEVAAAIVGAEVWEAFVDEDTGKFLLIEEYVSEEAFFKYEEEVTAAGVASRFRETLKDQSLLFLSASEDDRLNRSIDSWNGSRVSSVVSIKPAQTGS